MKTIRSTLLIGGFLLVLAACSSAQEDTQTPTELPAIAATLEEPASIPPTDTPQLDQPEMSPMPNGILTVDQETDLIRLVSLDGQVFDEWGFPGLNYGPQFENKFHFGGQVADGLIAAPCIYLSSLSGDPQITYHQDKALVQAGKKQAAVYSKIG